MRIRKRSLASATLLAVAIASSAPSARAQSVPDIADVYVPLSPSPVAIGGERHLVWEVRVHNCSSESLEVVRVEVDDETAQRLVTLEAADLPTQMAVLRGSSGTVPSIPADHVGVIYLWHTLQAGGEPSRLNHRVTLRTESGEEHVRQVPIDVYGEPPVVMRPPLLGEGWVAVNTLSNDAPHRRSVQVEEVEEVAEEVGRKRSQPISLPGLVWISLISLISLDWPGIACDLPAD